MYIALISCICTMAGSFQFSSTFPKPYHMYEFSHQHAPSNLHSGEVQLTTSRQLLPCWCHFIKKEFKWAENQWWKGTIGWPGSKSILPSVDMCALQLVLQKEYLNITFIICVYWCRVCVFAWWHSSNIRSAIEFILMKQCRKLYNKISGVITRTCSDRESSTN
jgi:hypothetical protein